MDNNDEPADKLSECEREVLFTALDRGYFDVPRQTSLSELADELDKSEGEAMEKLRHGTAALVSHHRDDGSPSRDGRYQ
jgi:predicted DNA binding protein